MLVYIQRAHGFGLPADPATPVIRRGPSTGVAPFRAFLHDRQATKAPGRNWLFFGHQHNKPNLPALAEHGSVVEMRHQRRLLECRKTEVG